MHGERKAEIHIMTKHGVHLQPATGVLSASVQCATVLLLVLKGRPRWLELCYSTDTQCCRHSYKLRTVKTIPPAEVK